MHELGKKSKIYHNEIFDFIIESDIKKCLFICSRKEEIYYKNFLKKSNKFLFLNEINNISKTINKFTKKGDYILVKGSRYWQLERIFKEID